MQKILYHKRNVILYTILGLVFFFLPLFLILIKISESTELISLFIIIIIIGGYFYFRIFKAFIHIVINKPMIVLTSEKYIDNLNGVSIKWNEIQNFTLENKKSTFAVFHLKNSSQLYNNLNIFKRTFYKFEAYTGISLRTNLTFAKGKNEDIFDEIQNVFKKTMTRK